MDIYDVHGFISVHTIQDMGVCCTLQHPAAHCNALQRTATHCSVHTIQDMGFIIVYITWGYGFVRYDMDIYDMYGSVSVYMILDIWGS